jgi:hypothetical protein
VRGGEQAGEQLKREQASNHKTGKWRLLEMLKQAGNGLREQSKGVGSGREQSMVSWRTTPGNRKMEALLENRYEQTGTPESGKIVKNSRSEVEEELEKDWEKQTGRSIGGTLGKLSLVVLEDVGRKHSVERSLEENRSRGAERIVEHYYRTSR